MRENAHGAPNSKSNRKLEELGSRGGGFYMNFLFVYFFITTSLSGVSVFAPLIII